MKKILLFVLLVVNFNLFADDGFDEDDDGFDDNEITSTTDKKSAKSKSAFNFDGSLTLLTSYNFSHEKPINDKQNDFRDWSSLKLSTNLNLDYKFDNGFKIKSNLKVYQDFIYDIKDEEYKITPLDYDRDTDINELYLQGSFNSKTDFKIGRQIVVWGKSDNIRIADILNPLDNRIPGVVDIEDLRLGRTMSKLDYFFDKWALSGIILHENRFSKNPQYGSDFMPAKNTEANEPDNNIKNSGFASSLAGNFTGYDISFYYANFYMDKSYIKKGILEYDKTNMIGTAYNKVLGSFLLKTELAVFDNIKYNNTEEGKSRADVLIGLEYNGISDGSLSIEIANRHINNYDEKLDSMADRWTQEDELQTAIRFSQSYFNQTLDFSILASGYGSDGSDGGFVRSWLDYDINDSFITTFGFINYHGGDKPNFVMIEDNDRIFASLKYSF
ncbi:MAG: hypothetical protein DRQ51_10370 [Gammaproteobacteria bacterium]|nr:MAG: hypothetical protein DRQ51_10370 [Gammaproteobacteria bacterium]